MIRTAPDLLLRGTGSPVAKAIGLEAHCHLRKGGGGELVQFDCGRLVCKESLHPAELQAGEEVADDALLAPEVRRLRKSFASPRSP